MKCTNLDIKALKHLKHIDVNKNFFKGQKGSRSNVGLNWNAQVGDGFLNVTLSGSDRNKQGKALQLRYNIPTSKFMRFFK